MLDQDPIFRRPSMVHRALRRFGYISAPFDGTADMWGGVEDVIGADASASMHGYASEMFKIVGSRTTRPFTCEAVLKNETDVLGYQVFKSRPGNLTVAKTELGRGIWVVTPELITPPDCAAVFTTQAHGGPRNRSGHPDPGARLTVYVHFTFVRPHK